MGLKTSTSMELATYILENIAEITVIFLTFLGTYYLYNYGFYWAKKQVPGPFPLPFLGNFFPRWMGTMSLIDYDFRYYSDYGGKRYCGFFEFSQKSIMVGDLEILKHILIKDFDNFVNRSNASMADPIVDKMVLVLQDEVWRKVRSMLTPAFSSGKLRVMVPLITQNSHNFIKQLFRDDQTEVEHEMCSIVRKYSVDVIATIAFGIEANELEKKKGEFTANAIKIFTSLPRWKRFLFLFFNIFPFFSSVFKFRLRDEAAPQFFKTVIEETLKRRKEENIARHDFLHLLKEAQERERETEDEQVMTEHVMLAQCITFFAAGVDTVSTTVSMCLHCLAFHQDVQDKLLREIDDVLSRTGGSITFDAINQMKYLDMVLQETERMYPSAPRTYRVSKNKYTLPGTKVELEPGTVIVIPIRCIHYDPEHYRNPEKFDPERFSSEMRHKRHPLSFLTFGQGPRNCLGMRFATIEMKACIVDLLRQARVSPCSRSRNPIEVNKLSGVFRVEGGVWIRITKRKGNGAIATSTDA